MTVLEKIEESNPNALNRSQLENSLDDDENDPMPIDGNQNGNNAGDDPTVENSLEESTRNFDHGIEEIVNMGIADQTVARQYLLMANGDLNLAVSLILQDMNNE